MIRRTLLVTLVAVSLLAQGAGPHVLVPTETQRLRLENSQLKARLAVADILAAQNRYSAAMQALSNEGDAVIRENKWPENTQFDIDKLTFSAPRPAGPKK